MSEIAASDASAARPVPDWQTGRVTLVLPTAEMYAYNAELAALELLYADLVRELSLREDVACLVPAAPDAEKMARLSGLSPECFPVVRLPDIWVRDFAPVAALPASVKFRYRPLYSDAKLNAAIDEAFLAYLDKIGAPVRLDDLVLEGGNFVHDGAGTGIVTEKVFAVNRGLARSAVRERLREALGLQRLVLVPAEPGDRTGHVDGMLRFVAKGLLAVNDYSALGDGGRFQTRLYDILDRELPDVRRLVLPYRACEEKRGGWYDARGNYANFLMTRSRVYLPIYGVPEDDLARQALEAAHEGGVSPIDARSISRFGGSLNCISWNQP